MLLEKCRNRAATLSIVTRHQLQVAGYDPKCKHPTIKRIATKLRLT
jgi:hypothetical protein